jgi:hypothetical protein
MLSMISGSAVCDLYSEMRQARLEWERASAGLRQAVQLFQDLGGASDGVASLRTASAHELETLEKYNAAVLAYAVGVEHSRPS